MENQNKGVKKSKTGDKWGYSSIDKPEEVAGRLTLT